MVTFRILGDDIDVPRNVALLDTNVVVAAINENDNLHPDVAAYFDVYDDYVFLVTPPVVVEACGLLSRRRDNPLVVKLMSWLLTPGNNIIFPTHYRPTDVQNVLDNNAKWMRDRQVDYVDAHLMHVATALTNACELNPHVPILTFDTGDYIKCAKQGYKFSVFDMRDLRLQEFH